MCMDFFEYEFPTHMRNATALLIFTDSAYKDCKKEWVRYIDA